MSRAFLRFSGSGAPPNETRTESEWNSNRANGGTPPSYRRFRKAAAASFLTPESGSFSAASRRDASTLGSALKSLRALAAYSRTSGLESCRPCMSGGRSAESRLVGCLTASSKALKSFTRSKGSWDDWASCASIAVAVLVRRAQRAPGNEPFFQRTVRTRSPFLQRGRAGIGFRAVKNPLNSCAANNRVIDHCPKLRFDVRIVDETAKTIHSLLAHAAI